MKKEKIIKQQARSALRGNLTVLVCGLLLAATAALLSTLLMDNLGIIFNVYDPDSGEANLGMEGWEALLTAGSAALIAVASPLFNGFLKAAANAVIRKSCSARDLLFYFTSPLRYFKTLVMNMTLCVIWMTVSLPAELSELLLGSDNTALSVAVITLSALWKLFAWLLFVHYPLLSYAIDDSRELWRYVFGLIGFSFKNLGNLLRLLLSMSGWIALSALIAPCFYTVPYLAAAAANSARWLLILKPNKK